MYAHDVAWKADINSDLSRSSHKSACNLATLSIIANPDQFSSGRDFEPLQLTQFDRSNREINMDHRLQIKAHLSM